MAWANALDGWMRERRLDSRSWDLGYRCVFCSHVQDELFGGVLVNL